MCYNVPVVSICMYEDLILCGMLHCIFGWQVPNILKYWSAFIIMVNQESQKTESSAVPLWECQMCYKMIIHHVHLKLFISSKQQAVRLFWLYKLQDKNLRTEMQMLLWSVFMFPPQKFTQPLFFVTYNLKVAMVKWPPFCYYTMSET